MIYNIFYSGYFSSTEYHDWAFLGGKIPTKLEVLFGGFKDFSNWFNCKFINYISNQLEKKTK